MEIRTDDLQDGDLPSLYLTIVSEIGVENTLKLAKLIGGEYIYFPKSESIERHFRNRKIKREFNGYNFKQLARKYKLTEIQIRNICEELIKEKRLQAVEGQISMLE